MSEQAFTEADIQRWLWLRAMEWANWPTFVSQPLAPALLLLFPWYQVVVGIAAADVAWCLVRYRFVSVALARSAVFFVQLKWPAARICGGYLLFHRSYLAGTIALLWPLVGTFIMFQAKSVESKWL